MREISRYGLFSLVVCNAILLSSAAALCGSSHLSQTGQIHFTMIKVQSTITFSMMSQCPANAKKLTFPFLARDERIRRVA